MDFEAAERHSRGYPFFWPWSYPSAHPAAAPDFENLYRLGYPGSIIGSERPPDAHFGLHGSHPSHMIRPKTEAGMCFPHSNTKALFEPPFRGYKCKICQQLCFSKQDLIIHNSSVHKADPRPFHCETCGRQFATSAYLSQHRRIHTGTRPYGCKFCDKRFTQLSHVQQHERIHTGDKPYKCWQCSKSFTQMSNLQSHQRQHMKDKPHRCEACFMCFDSRDELDTHIAAKHSTNKYSKVLVCRVCGKNYNSETYLNKHLAKHKEAGQVSGMGGASSPGANTSGSDMDVKAHHQEQQQQLQQEMAQHPDYHHHHPYSSEHQQPVPNLGSYGMSQGMPDSMPAFPTPFPASSSFKFPF